VRKKSTQPEPGLESNACREAGCHDYTEPVVVRTGPHLLSPSAEAAVVFCRRCGARLVAGWTGTELKNLDAGHRTEEV
jgi:hypothetical protein